MAIQNINDVLITNEIKAKIKNNSASSLPLNSSAQGWSATKIREKLYRAVCSESGDLDDNLLDVLATRLSTIKGILEILDANILLKADQTSLELLESQLEDGTIIVDSANKDGDGLVIKSSYGVSLVLSYDNATNTLTSRLYASDNTLLDTHSAILTKSSSVADGLQSKEHFVKLQALPTNTDLTNSLAGKVPQTRTIIGLDLADNILLDEFKTAIGNATQSLAGLMSETDKARLDALHDLLGSDDADAVVNTINEVLAIFNQYPEGADLVNALAGKVDKVAGYGLSKNDYSDIEKNKVALSDTHRQDTNNPHETTFAQLNSKPTTLAGFGIADAYNKEYIDALKDLNGWSSSLITQSALTNGQTIAKATLEEYDIIKLFAINTSTNEIDTDSFDTSVGLVDTYEYRLFDNENIKFVIGATCTFTDTVGGYQLKIIGQKYVAQEAENVNYDNTVKNLLVATNVQDAIDEITDEVLTPTYENVLHEDLITEITATNDVEIIDDAGVLIKVEGNEPTNLQSGTENIISTTPFSATKSVNTVANGNLVNTGNGGGEIPYPYISIMSVPKNQKIYVSVKARVTNSVCSYLRFFAYDNVADASYYFHTTGNKIETPSQNNWYNVSNIINTPNNDLSARFYHAYADATTANGKVLEIDYIKVYNITDMINKGIKNDSGVSFADLSDAEIKEQMDIWVTNGFPTVINKIVSKSDNLFDSEFYDLTDLESENLVANSDLLIPKASPNENQALGFTYTNATDITLSNGVAKFTATAQYGCIQQQSPNVFNAVSGNTYYFYSKVKNIGSSCSMILGGFGDSAVSIVNAENWQFTSKIFTASADYTGTGVRINNNNISDFTPIEVDYIGAINITDLVSRGILPSGLTDAQYKAILDNACNRSKTPMVNVPLRETSLISVEPSTAYKFIKASDNTPIHKVIEYTTDEQVVKVTTLSYTDHKATFTTQSQTTKIKLVSDLMNRVPNLVSNSDLLIPKESPNENQPLGFKYSNATDITLTNGIAKFTASVNLGRIYYSYTSLAAKYYIFGRYKSDSSLVKLRFKSMDSNHTGSGNFEHISMVNDATAGSTIIGINDWRSSGWTPIEVDYIGAINITTFINAGVVNDTGTLFSRLTNDEIKEQMDIWVQNGFPDHVIHALYHNGVDSAIAIKYNDADDVFRPQQIDELPLGITLRSGEYWQDGYVIKQNGNAEYYPLPTTFSAWNYGQLEAVYDSGIPADFTIKFAQNTNAQVQTNSDYLIEARERLDTLRRNQELLIEKLGVDVDNDNYDSFVGITSAEYEYFGLEGIEEGDKLNIDAYGQGVLNLLPNTITASQTAFGLTVAYDETTGTFTVNGTSTGAGNIILKTGMSLGLPQGTTVQLMRYFVDGTVNLNGSYIGYILAGTSVSNRINENSESLYDPYINASGDLKASGALSGVAGTSGQSLIFQVYKEGMVFTDFKFKLGVFEGLTLQPFVMPSVSNSTAVDVYNHTANKLNTAFTTTTTSGITVTYDPLSQEYIFDGTASGANSITLSTNLFSVKSGDRLSIKRLYQSGDITPVSALPIITLISGSTTIVSNNIYKMTAPEGQTPTPDVTFNSGTASADLTDVTLKLSFASGDVFNSYRCRIMIHDKSSDIGYAPYSSTKIGSISLEAKARGKLSFTAIEFGILSFVPQTDKLNVVFGTSLTDLTKTNLEYNAGIQSPNRRISELNERLSNVDNVFRDKVIAIWGDSRESNNPTSDPEGVGEQLDTSYPALLAKKLGATVLNFGLSGGAWAENTTQQDASSAIVNRVLTEDTSASADIILISSMNDFKLATPLGSPDTSNKTASTFYGAMRLTYDRLATKYPAKKIWLVLPQKRFDESTNYGGGSYLAYRKAQIEVAREYGIQTIDLYNNFANGGGGNTAPTFPTTTMLNATHFTAIGNDIVAELIARALLGNGNSGSVDVIPPLPTTAGTYTLKVVISEQGIPTFSWTVDE